MNYELINTTLARAAKICPALAPVVGTVGDEVTAQQAANDVAATWEVVAQIARSTLTEEAIEKALVCRFAAAMLKAAGEGDGAAAAAWVVEMETYLEGGR